MTKDPDIAGVGLKRSFSLAGKRLSEWRRRSQYRQILAELDMAQIKDAGFRVEDIRREIQKPFWKK